MIYSIDEDLMVNHLNRFLLAGIWLTIAISIAGEESRKGCSPAASAGEAGSSPLEARRSGTHTNVEENESVLVVMVSDPGRLPLAGELLSPRCSYHSPWLRIVVTMMSSRPGVHPSSICACDGSSIALTGSQRSM